MKKKVGDLLKQLTIVDWILVVGVALGFLLVAFSVLTKILEKPVQVEYLAVSDQASAVRGQLVVWVDVAGAVANPGVYQLTRESRIKDALVAAGGLSDGADRDYVARVMNLAAIVKDGQKVYVPEGGRKVASEKNSGFIDINTATKAELETLWGVGEARAEAIIAGRPYQSIEELLEKKILPSNVFERNKDRLSVY